MEGMSREDVERLMFFEHAREQAEREHKANDKDASVLTRWGGALLELAHFRQGHEAYAMIEQAVSKFEHALRLDDQRHEARWCLGNAYTSQGFLSAEASHALALFEKAGACFRAAVDAQPENESYKRALEMTAKAPALYAELQRQLQAANAANAARAAGAAAQGGRAAAATSEPAPHGVRAIPDGWFDAAGWVALVVLGIGIAALSRASAPVQPAA